MHSYTLANRLFDGPIANLLSVLCILIQIFPCAHPNGEKGLNCFKFGTFVDRFQSDSMAVKGLIMHGCSICFASLIMQGCSICFASLIMQGCSICFASLIMQGCSICFASLIMQGCNMFCFLNYAGL